MVAGSAHHNYKVPIKIARELVKDLNLSDLRKTITSTIGQYEHCHPEAVLNKASIAKRIVGVIKEYMARLLLDRYLLNWLSKNRLDLREIEGELRNGLVKKIQCKRYENE